MRNPMNWLTCSVLVQIGFFSHHKPPDEEHHNGSDDLADEACLLAWHIEAQGLAEEACNIGACYAQQYRQDEA